MDLGPRLPPEVRDSPASARAGPHISALSTSRVGVAEITARSGRPAATLVASNAHVRDAGGFSVLQPAGRSSQRDGVRGARRPCGACHGHSISSCLWRSLRSGPCPRRGEAAATTTKASSPAEVCDRPGSTGERAVRVGEEGRRMESGICRFRTRCSSPGEERRRVSSPFSSRLQSSLVREGFVVALGC